MTNDDTQSAAPSPAEIHHAALRARIGSQHGLSTDDSALFLTQTDEESMQAHAALIAERLTRRATGNIAPREGHTVETGRRHTSMSEFTRQMFDRPE